MGNKTLQLFSQLIMIFFVALLSSCTSLQKAFITKVNPNNTYTTDSGFSFRFPMDGEWYPDGNFVTQGYQKPQYAVGQIPEDDGSTKLAVVRHGPIWTPEGKTVSKKEIFESFKRDIENSAKGERFSKAKSVFSEKKYKGADCLSFETSAEDNSPVGLMNLINDGLICLHPTKAYQFIWMAISARTPVTKPIPQMSEDKTKLFDSLGFE